MDAIRKQLDALMGAIRNGDVTEVDRHFHDRDVCRFFLSGLCPHELFQLTKMDMGPCPKVHSLQLRKEYEEAKAKGVDNYDRDLEDVIDKLIVECDCKIARALKRLDEEDAKAAIAISVSEVTQSPEILELSKQIKEKQKEADLCDFEGNTDLKIRAIEVLEELRTKRADMQSMLLLDAFNKDRALLPQPLANPPQLAPVPASHPDPKVQEMINEKLKKDEDLGEQGMVDEAQKTLEGAEALKKVFTAADVRITDQRLRVCDICGAFLSVYDSDRRLADHFGGKLHLGYMQIRDKLAELQEKTDEGRNVSDKMMFEMFLSFLARIAELDELVEVAYRFLVGFQQALEFIRQPSIDTSHVVVERLIKANSTIQLSSYIEAGCFNPCDINKNISKLHACHLGLLDHKIKAENVVKELESILGNAEVIVRADLKDLHTKRDDDVPLFSSCLSPSSKKSGVTDYAILMTSVFWMVKKDYTMQEKVISALSFKSSSGELESYCLMWSLRPFIDSEIIEKAWRYVR